jgi:hypothetical protein
MFALFNFPDIRMLSTGSRLRWALERGLARSPYYPGKGVGQLVESEGLSHQQGTMIERSRVAGVEAARPPPGTANALEPAVPGPTFLGTSRTLDPGHPADRYIVLSGFACMARLLPSYRSNSAGVSPFPSEARQSLSQRRSRLYRRSYSRHERIVLSVVENCPHLFAPSRLTSVTPL